MAGIMRARRALLYTPGDDFHKIQKAASLEADCICLDMEDGVAPSRKQAARQTIANSLMTLRFGQAERLTRINPVGSGLEELDLQSVLPAHPDGIVIPKVENKTQIQKVSHIISDFETRKGWSDGEMGLFVIVENAKAIIDLKEIASADPRMRGIIFGAEDFAGDIGATRTRESMEVFYARSAVLTHCAAFGLQAIDMVYLDFQDSEGLYKEALNGAKLGFTGKQIIHPSQILPVQKAFTPDEDSIRYAQKILDAFSTHQEAGIGAFALDGKMIDAPVIKTAQNVLARARAAGII